MNFQRGIEPIKSLDIGINYSNRLPEPGRLFLVHFRLRKSCPEFYPLQKKEAKGEPIIAICKFVKRAVYDPFEFILSSSIICEIDGEEFLASMDSVGEWEIA